MTTYYVEIGLYVDADSKEEAITATIETLQENTHMIHVEKMDED
jgi:hypothetical protein